LEQFVEGPAGFFCPVKQALMNGSGNVAWAGIRHSVASRYPPVPRPIPIVDYKVVQQAVTAAVANGTLWLVYGNDSVFKEKPTAIQLDADAVLYRPPQPLPGIDFLPPRLPEAWTKETEPKTSVEKLYAEIKAKFGKPWPETLFLEGLNAALAQGFIARVSGKGPLTSLTHDGACCLVIKVEVPPPPPPPSQDRRMTNMTKLSVQEVQTLAEEMPDLAKSLVGCDLVVEARISIKPKPDADLATAEEILARIKKEWRF